MGNPVPVKRKLISLDSRLTSLLTLPEDRRAARFAALLIAHSGDGLIWVALLASAWFLGGARWNDRVILTATGIAATEVFTVIFKAVIRRKRPAGTFGRFYRRTDPHSFPSGHSARAAMLCILSAVLGPLPAFIAIAVWSPIMMLSRIAIGIHYVLDVAAGIVLGVVLTCIILAGMPWIISLI